MKFEVFNFHVLQTRYVKVAIDRIVTPQFAPDGKTALQVNTLLIDAEDAMVLVMDRFDALNVARGELHAAQKAAHDACVDVYACMKSCYRNNRGALASIKGLPKADKTPVQTLTRIKNICRRWAQLPPPPGGGGPFIVGTLTQAQMVALCADLEQKLSTYNDAAAQLRSGRAGLDERDRELTDMVSAALAQGRSIYREGTPERAYIESIPTEPSAHLPVQSTITEIESTTAGTVHLEFTADHATSFSVWHKGPAEAQFTKVGESLLPGEFLATGLSGGEHAFQVVGQNSRGDGPASEPATIAVAAAVAA